MTGDQHHEAPTRLPGESSLRLFPAAPSEEEVKREAEKAADNAYKLRQLEIDEQQVKVAKSNRDLTIALAVFTFLGVIAGGIQVWLTRRSIDVADRSAKAAENAAYQACLGSKLARAALIQAENGAEDTHQATLASMYQGMAARESERAIIREQVYDPVFTIGIDVGTPLKLQNIGKTSAYNYKAVLKGVLLDKGVEPDFAFPKDQVSSASGSIGPGESDPSTPENKFDVFFRLGGGQAYQPTQQDVADYSVGKKVFFTIGRIMYRDAFGTSHWENFCHYSQRVLIGTTFDSGHAKCANYNQSDTYTSAKQESKQVPEIAEIKCVAPVE